MVRVFRHHIPVGTVVQLSADAMLMFGAVLVAVAIQHSPYGAAATDATRRQPSASRSDAC